MTSRRIGAVLIVLDGLRPDMVTIDVMPALARFRAMATSFTNARSVFPSVSTVAAATLATGMLPAVHGVIGAAMYVPQITADRVLDLGDARILRGLDQALDGRLVAADTFADRLAEEKRRVAIVDASAGGVGLLLNPRAARNRHWSFATAGRHATATPEAWDEVVKRFGYPPERSLPRYEDTTYATTIFIEQVLETLVPDVAVLWLAEPDATQHYREIGSIETEMALRHVDRQMGRVLSAIDHRQGLAETLVIVASDHGHITGRGYIDVAAQMQQAQIAVAAGADLGRAPLALGADGYGTISVRERDGATMLEQPLRWLMDQPWVGNVFTADRDGIAGRFPGTLSLALAGLNHERAPDVVFTFASDGGLDRNGIAGRGLHGCPAIAPGGGVHGGLNAYEMNTVLLLAGPGFAPGRQSPATAGIIDIGPTLLGRFGAALDPRSTGRSLAGLAFEPEATTTYSAGVERYTQSVAASTSAGTRLRGTA